MNNSTQKDNARLPRVKGKAFVLPSEVAEKADSPTRTSRTRIWGDTFPLVDAPGASHIWHARFIDWLQVNFDEATEDLDVLPQELDTAGRLNSPFEWKEPVRITEPGTAEVWERYLAEYAERSEAWARYTAKAGEQACLTPAASEPDDEAQRKAASEDPRYPQYWLVHFAAWVLDQATEANSRLEQLRWRRPRVLEAALHARNNSRGPTLADYPPFNGEPAEPAALRAFYDLLEDVFEKAATETRAHELDFFMRIMFTDPEPADFSGRRRREFERVFTWFLNHLVDGRPIWFSRWRQSELTVRELWDLMVYQGGLKAP